MLYHDAILPCLHRLVIPRNTALPRKVKWGKHVEDLQQQPISSHVFANFPSWRTGCENEWTWTSMILLYSPYIFGFSTLFLFMNQWSATLFPSETEGCSALSENLNWLCPVSHVQRPKMGMWRPQTQDKFPRTMLAWNHPVEIALSYFSSPAVPSGVPSGVPCDSPSVSSSHVLY